MANEAAAQSTNEAVLNQETPNPVDAVTPEPTKVDPPADPTPPAEGKPTEGGKPEGEADKKPDTPEVPEKYDLKLPEGIDANPEQIEAIASYAKENKLSQDQAQAILDREIATREHLSHQNNKVWLESLRADKEIGGVDLEKNGELAFKAASQWFGPEFVDLIKSANLNNHPMLFKGLVKLGKASANDRSISGNDHASGEKSVEELFYPNMK